VHGDAHGHSFWTQHRDAIGPATDTDWHRSRRVR
jgi:hypothetical protein